MNRGAEVSREDVEVSTEETKCQQKRRNVNREVEKSRGEMKEMKEMKLRE